MLVQRTVTLIAVLIGLGIGLLVTGSKVDGGIAEAAKSKGSGSGEVRCFGYRYPSQSAHPAVHVHNPGTAEGEVVISAFAANGTAVGGEPDHATVPANGTLSLVLDEQAAAVKLVFSSQLMLVDGEMIYSDNGDGQDHRQVACVQLNVK